MNHLVWVNSPAFSSFQQQRSFLRLFENMVHECWYTKFYYSIPKNAHAYCKSHCVCIMYIALQYTSYNTVRGFKREHTVFVFIVQVDGVSEPCHGAPVIKKYIVVKKPYKLNLFPKVIFFTSENLLVNF